MTLSFNLRVIQGYFEPTLWRTIRIFVMGQKNNFLRKKEKSALRHLRGWQDSIWEVIQIKWYITICRKLKTLTKEQKIKKFIMWYTRTRQTIKLEDTTVQPKADVCDQSGFRISNPHLIILAPIMHIFALTWKDWIKVKAYKAQCCGRSKTATLETMKEKG